ncbi:5'/3'-nucleotidase SurE [Limibaculum sp. M0105]|uniref:5'-nucleotidase SurE n=1 Tax=Thermohalobaculum xanthum TaxID=2753746 RepID=A0A8J7M433_9RHOB|nr:5'/3'-nucleotidase SurE [Thermohalobaculum xanthum]MBK0397804.1 5'/3'-nucleotidase SurE [Thermohalobaculum xanthum]
MRILITNDDGINAPGLKLAESIAAEIAGPSGEVWVVAPDNERSGASHAISYTAPMRLTRLSDRRFSVDGYPADCALVGLHRVMKECPPDLVISGINRGHNVAEDLVYSGTVGAAMEAALAGFPAISMSQFFRNWEGAPDDLWDPARAHGTETLRRVLAMPRRRGVFYNVNFPAVRPEAVKGLAVCPHGLRAEATFEVVPYTAPNGREFQFLRHTTANSSAPEGSDARLCLEGWITATPVIPQMTAYDLIEGARATLSNDSRAASV